MELQKTSNNMLNTADKPTQSFSICHQPLFRMLRYPTITKQSFVKNYDMLCNELEINSLMPDLRGRSILTQIEIDKINIHTHRRRKAGEFLEILFARYSLEWIGSFLLCLEQNHYTHIIRKLEGTNNLVRHTEYPIRPLRPQQYEHRVFIGDEEVSRAIQRSEDSQILDDSSTTLGFSIVNIYDGSLCFLLDPMTEKAILDMWTSDKKLKAFLNKLFSTYKSRQFFQQKREIKVIISEKANDFVFRENDRRSLRDMNTKDVSGQYSCSGCFRQTVFKNYMRIIDEIETSMMEETFKSGVVPGCIKTACIDDKDKRSRSERADIFLRFVLTSEKLLMEFKKMFTLICKIELDSCTCYLHGGLKSIPVAFKQPIELFFEVTYSKEDDVLTVTSVNKGNSSDSIDIISETNAYSTAESTKDFRLAVIGTSRQEIDHFVKHFLQSSTSETCVLPYINQESFRIVNKQIGVQLTVTTVLSDIFTDIDPYRIANYIAMTSPGPHAVLLIVSSYNYAINFDSLLKPLMHVLGDSLVKYLVPTFVDTLEQYIAFCLKSSLTAPGLFERGQYITCSSRFNNNNFLIDLVKVIVQIQSETGKPFFTNQIYTKAELLFTQKSKDYAGSYLEKYQLKTARTIIKEETSLREQQTVKDSNKRDALIQNENILSDIADLLLTRLRLHEASSGYSTDDASDTKKMREEAYRFQYKF